MESPDMKDFREQWFLLKNFMGSSIFFLFLAARVSLPCVVTPKGALSDVEHTPPILGLVPAEEHNQSGSCSSTAWTRTRNFKWVP